MQNCTFCARVTRRFHGLQFGFDVGHTQETDGDCEGLILHACSKHNSCYIRNPYMIKGRHGPLQHPTAVIGVSRLPSSSAATKATELSNDRRNREVYTTTAQNIPKPLAPISLLSLSIKVHLIPHRWNAYGPWSKLQPLLGADVGNPRPWQDQDRKPAPKETSVTVHLHQGPKAPIVDRHCTRAQQHDVSNPWYTSAGNWLH